MLFERVVNTLTDLMRDHERQLVKEYKSTSEYYKNAQKYAVLINDKELHDHMSKLAKADNFPDLIRIAKKLDIHSAPTIPGLAFRAFCFAGSFVSNGASAGYYVMHLHDDIVKFAYERGHYDSVAKMATSDPMYQYYLDSRISQLAASKP